MEASPVVPFLSVYGQFNLQSFEMSRHKVHVAMWMDDLTTGEPPLVRLQSSCTTGTALGGAICDCNNQLRGAFTTIASEGRGVAIYFAEEARGHGLHEKLKGMAEMMLRGADTVEAYERRGLPADKRDYADVAPILREIGIVLEIRLMTNNPQKVEALERAGYKIVERVPLEVTPSASTQRYLETKKHKMGHLISVVD